MLNSYWKVLNKFPPFVFSELFKQSVRNICSFYCVWYPLQAYKYGATGAVTWSCVRNVFNSMAVPRLIFFNPSHWIEVGWKVTSWNYHNWVIESLPSLDIEVVTHVATLHLIGSRSLYFVWCTESANHAWLRGFRSMHIWNLLSLLLSNP